MKTLWGIVGLPGSGKSQAISFGKQFAPVIVMGDVIREETLRRGLEINPENLGKIARELRKNEGKAAIARRCAEKIEQIQSPIIIIDGIRSMFEVDFFRERYNLILIALSVSEKIRYERLRSRNRADDSQEMQIIRQRDERELSFGLGDVIDNAYYIIDNNGSLLDLERNCTALFQKLRKDSKEGK
ncbi:MAG: AAA family ATPase [Candidatus Lokiarchaeota archaeon]|nr:AAA family ATPase [Candidatus Harpocratesius repetitus]